MDTEVDVPNPNLLLIPGMYAEVHLTLDRRDSVITLPLLAVDSEADSATARVMVITPNRRVEIRRVELGLETASRVEVRSGLNEGDLVVLTGRSGLEPGGEVHPKITVLAASSGS